MCGASPITQAPLVLGIRNGAADAINVSAIGGSINSPFDFGFYVQNFTFVVRTRHTSPTPHTSPTDVRRGAGTRRRGIV